MKMKYLNVACVVLQIAISGTAVAQTSTGGTGSSPGSASGGSLGSSAGTPGTNSLGTALPSGGGRTSGSAAGNIDTEREDKNVDRKIKSICKGC